MFWKSAGRSGVANVHGPSSVGSAEPAAGQKHVPLLPGLVEKDVRLGVRGPLQRCLGNILKRRLTFEQDHLGRGIRGDDFGHLAALIRLRRNSSTGIGPVAVVGQVL